MLRGKRFAFESVSFVVKLNKLYNRDLGMSFNIK